MLIQSVKSKFGSTVSLNVVKVNLDVTLWMRVADDPTIAKAIKIAVIYSSSKVTREQRRTNSNF